MKLSEVALVLTLFDVIRFNGENQSPKSIGDNAKYNV